MIESIHRYSFREKYLFCWNLDYDMNAVLKHLPESVLHKLATREEAYFRGTKIRIIPRKALMLTRHKHRVTLYDAAQFYGFARLKTAAEKRLGMAKGSLEGITHLDPDRYDTDERYRKDIDHYAILDARLCRLLAKLMYDNCLDFMKPRTFYSPASLAQQFALERLKNSLALPKRGVLDHALKSYQGGRFEIFRAGTIEGCHGYDINSAYPKKESELIRCDAGRWERIRRYDPDAFYGFYHCDVEIPDSFHVSPVRLQLPDSLMIFPTGKVNNIYLTQEEIALLREEGIKPRIRTAWCYYPRDPEPKPVFEWVEELYEQRLLWNESNPDMAQVAKIILNGLYGKFIQLIAERPQFVESVDNARKIQDVVFDRQGQMLGYLVGGDFKAGILFNPVWASVITAHARCELYRAVRDDPECAVLFATDGVIADRKLKLPLGNRLGQWKHEINNRDVTVVGSGVYEIVGGKTKARGFTKALRIRDILAISALFGELLGTKVRITTTRNKKLKQSARSAQPNRWDDFNVITEVKRKLDLNSDRKRVWDKQFDSCLEVLESWIGSRALSGKWAAEYDIPSPLAGY